MISIPKIPGFSSPSSAAAGGAAGAAAGAGVKMSLEAVEGSPKTKISFVYNPSSFSLDRAVTWDDAKSLKLQYGILSFTGGGSDTLAFEVMIDRTEESKDILKDVKDIYGLTKNTVEDKNKFYRPPLCKLTWKDFTFGGVVVSVKFDFLLFDEEGKPKRANVSISMQGRAFLSSVTVDKFFAPMPK